MQAKKEKLVQRRASTRRSRAGCSTCKRRRVKCDESHPHCIRCLKANLHCSYSDTSSSTKCPEKKSKPILPKLDGVAQLLSLQPTGILPNETEIENRYLRYFHQETTSGFQSAWDWTLWNRLVLQGCHREAFVRYAVVAIGALHKSLRASSSTGQELPADMADPMAKLHREFAYLTYGKALKKMQVAIDTNSGPRLALIACLLVVCFESHTGNRYKAMLHASYGLQILQHWTSQNRLQYDNKPSVVSPSPLDVEDEIVEAFRNLDIQIITVSDRRTLETHEGLMGQDSSIIGSMPHGFSSLDQARSYWNLIMRRTCHFIATTWRRTDSSSLAREFSTKVPGGVVVTVGDTIHTTSVKVGERVRVGQRRYSVEISRWLEAFEPTLLRIRRNDNITLREYVIATMLQIQALSAKIHLAGVVFTQEILYDAYLPEFKEIIRLSQDVARVRHSIPNHDFWAGSFLLDLGLIVPLFLVLLRCRDSVLRRHAIDILNTWHVECWWDPLLIVAIGRFIIEVEEEGMVDRFIPESSRAILTAKCHRPPQRVSLIQCVQRTGGPDGGLKWTEKFIEW
ncbi:hypothetical protein CC78DRAFT_619475 [Lojkania enalia]|uniref:Zn(2)-C6 fungal-type domain-containing protein n=1 Tax=Lojkania enalia TaxID=147567 RepID=A0A9P4K8G9_9PLEO|nr:hypothetical protein CC78DRAFT_619475 [Didymosphaeria enalia]